MRPAGAIIIVIVQRSRKGQPPVFKLCPGLTRIVMLTLLAGPVALTACTSAVKAISGTYAYYQVTEDEVRYLTWNPMSQRYHVSQVDGADPASFSSINHAYGRDRAQVFKGSRPIVHADPYSFTLRRSGYAADATQVFYQTTRLEGARPETFERLQDGWARDRENIYLGPVRLDICDIDSFEIMSPWQARDTQCYYADATRVDISDVATLEVLPAFYVRDQIRVYWRDQVVETADPGSFEVKSASPHSIARDARHCFSGPRIIGCQGLNEDGRAFCRCTPP